MSIADTESLNPLTAKLPRTMAEELARTAERQGVSNSALGRGRALQRPSALELAGDLVGSVKGAPRDLSTNPDYLSDYGK